MIRKYNADHSCKQHGCYRIYRMSSSMSGFSWISLLLCTEGHKAHALCGTIGILQHLQAFHIASLQRNRVMNLGSRWGWCPGTTLAGNLYISKNVNIYIDVKKTRAMEFQDAFKPQQEMSIKSNSFALPTCCYPPAYGTCKQKTHRLQIQ